MKNKKKRAFSLLEIIVVFMLVAAFTTIAGVSFLKTNRVGHFQDSVSIVKDKIQLAKKLSVLTQGSVSLIFSCDEPDGKICYTMTGEALPCKKLKNALEKKEPLPSVGHLSLESHDEVPYSWPICLVFYPNGACYSHTIPLKNSLSLKIDPTFKAHGVCVEVYTPAPITKTEEGSRFYPHELENKR